MQEEDGSPTSADLGGPIEDKVAQALEAYLRSNETRIYNSVLAEAVKHLPDPLQPVKDFVDTTRKTLADFGVTVSNDQLVQQLNAILPKEIVKPLVDLYGLLAPRFEWAMGQLLDNARVAADAVLAPIEAKIRELFHTLFTTVATRLAHAVGALVEAAVQKLLDVLKPIIAGLVAIVLAAIAQAVAMALMALLELVNTIGRFLLKTAKAVAMWLAKKIVMFVCKTILRIVAFLFGMPSGYVDAAWMETEAQIRI